MFRTGLDQPVRLEGEQPLPIAIPGALTEATLEPVRPDSFAGEPKPKHHGLVHFCDAIDSRALGHRRRARRLCGPTSTEALDILARGADIGIAPTQGAAVRACSEAKIGQVAPILHVVSTRSIRQVAIRCGAALGTSPVGDLILQ